MTRNTLSRTVLLVTVLCIACSVRGTSVGVSSCDVAREEAIDRVVESSAAEVRAAMREDFEGSRAYWHSDPNYLRVRSRVEELAPVRSLVMLEQGRAPGARYSSIWFVETREGVIELSTGIESQGVREGVVPAENWPNYLGRIRRLLRSPLVSSVSASAVDSMVYFLCVDLRDRRLLAIANGVPKKEPAFSAVAATFATSSLKAMPIELRTLAVEDAEDAGAERTARKGKVRTSP
jgi:hypothetical protein